MAYKAGDYFVDSNCIYQVTKVSSGKDFRGDEQDFIHYSPLGKEEVNYIPQSSIDKTGYRRLVTTKIIEQLFDNLTKKIAYYKHDMKDIRETVYKNEPIKIVELLKYLWCNQLNLDKDQRNLIDQITGRLAIEIAFVEKQSVVKVKEMFKAKLEKLPLFEQQPKKELSKNRNIRL